MSKRNKERRKRNRDHGKPERKVPAGYNHSAYWQDTRIPWVARVQMLPEEARNVPLAASADDPTVRHMEAQTVFKSTASSGPVEEAPAPVEAPKRAAPSRATLEERRAALTRARMILALGPALKW